MQIPNDVQNLGRRNPAFLAEKFGVIFGINVSLQIKNRHLSSHNESVDVVVAASLQLQTSLVLEKFVSKMGQVILEAVNLIIARGEKNNILKRDTSFEIFQAFDKQR